MGDEVLTILSFVTGVAIYSLIVVNALVKHYPCLGFAALFFTVGAFFNFIVQDIALTTLFLRIGAVLFLIGVVRLPKHIRR
jgi:hypothetical protein